MAKKLNKSVLQLALIPFFGWFRVPYLSLHSAHYSIDLPKTQISDTYYLLEFRVPEPIPKLYIYIYITEEKSMLCGTGMIISMPWEKTTKKQQNFFVYTLMIWHLLTDNFTLLKYIGILNNSTYTILDLMLFFDKFHRFKRCNKLNALLIP